MKKIIFGYIVCAVLILCAFTPVCKVYPSFQQFFYSDNYVSYMSRTSNKNFQIYDYKKGWIDFFVSGVNIGLGKPGYFPGDYAISKEEYLRWFEQIANMNVNTIRVYTKQPVDFYEALFEYNTTHLKTLYFMQGVYVDEEDIALYNDIYASDALIENNFINDIIEQSNIVHGRTKDYQRDVSQYLLGYILGVEWEPELVENTNLHQEINQYIGKYVKTNGASAFEVFLAHSADRLIEHETKIYQRQYPIAFCNWVTTDPLKHKNEPDIKEDKVAVNVENIQPTTLFKTGFFASYHVYPYYPEGIVYQEDYLKTSNPYQAYIQELVDYHSIPVLISEVGIPTSRGQTHVNPYTGYNQGFMSEKEQGEALVDLVQSIYNVDAMGALIFSWQDEWFKRAWNTMDLDISSHRPQWIDYMTSEQNYGLMSFDPGESSIIIDGKDVDWNEEHIVEFNNHLKMYNDEGYLYFLLDNYEENEPTYIGIDLIEGQGYRYYNGHDLKCDADFVIIIDGQDNSKVLVHSYYDPTYFSYGYLNNILERHIEYENPHAPYFIDIQQITSNEIYLPTSKTKVPVKMFDAGKLIYGHSNPTKDDYQSLSDFYIKDTILEMRIPYLMLNIADPSSSSIIDNMYENNKIAFKKISSITVSYGNSVEKYRLRTWKTPTYHERLKSSYYKLRNYFATLDNPVVIHKDIFWLLTEISYVKIYLPLSNWIWQYPFIHIPILFLLSIVIYMFFVLIIIHIKNYYIKLRNYKDMNKLIIEGYLKEKIIKSYRGMLLLRKLDDNCENYIKIKKFLESIAYSEYLKTMFVKNVDYRIIAMDIAAYFKWNELSEYIYKSVEDLSDIEIQYHGFYALSLMGEGEKIVSLFDKKCDNLRLSYRSLLEILTHYCGDKSVLYHQLLQSKDEYIVRICLKQIGKEKRIEFKDDIERYLDSQSFELQLDAIRTCGLLENRHSVEKIITFLDDSRWQIRAIAIEAISRIGFDGYEDILIHMLKDKEWQVRYNCAKYLTRQKNNKEILEKVRKLKDRYALDMMEHMIHIYCKEVSNDL